MKAIKFILKEVEIIAADPLLLLDFVFRPLALLSLLSVIVNVGLIVLIISKGFQLSTTRWFVMFLFTLVIWGASEFLGRISGNPEAANFWGLIGSSGWVFVGPVFLGFSLSYVGKAEVLDRLLYRFLIFGVAFIWQFVVWTTDFVSIHDLRQFEEVSWGWSTPTASYFALFVIWLESHFITSLLLLFHFYLKSRDQIKKQTQYIVLALLVPLIGGTITDAVLPIFDITILGTAVLLTSVQAVIVTYAILRYNLFVFNPATFVSNIVETMSEALVVFDKVRSIQFVNEAVNSFLGYKKDELVGQNMRKLIPAEKTWNDFEQHVVTPLAHGDVIRSFETSFVAKSGQVIPVSFSGSTLRDSRGQIIAFVGLVTDVRQIKSLITDVEAERNKISVALAGIADGVFVVTKENRISLLNKAAEEMLGVKFAEVTDKVADEVFRLYEADEQFKVADLFPKTKITTDRVVASKKNVKMIGPAGKEVYVDLVSSAIAENDLVNLGAIITIHDVSKEVELEEMKLDFVSMAAHELRTPLTSIRGYLSVLQEEIGEKLGKDQRSFLDKAFISSSQLAALVENLLSVSRIERGALKVSAEPADWSPIVQEIYNNFTNLAQEKQVNLKLELADNLPKVMVDKFRISEVLSNLIANALQYTNPNGSVTIISKLEKDGVLTQVIDTGQGIPASAIPKLFTKFFRVSGVLEQGSKGTGLGLYISKAIMDMHGGRIWVESELGKGSTFNFVVPFAPKEEATKDAGSASTEVDPAQGTKRYFKKAPSKT